ncbi:MAG: hypothetical protein ACYCV6_18355, partial [Steroidobacteraceae bacterium]
PRGCPPSVLEEYSRRLSFTCGRCEKRTTPASVRFLGRRVYVAQMPNEAYPQRPTCWLARRKTKLLQDQQVLATP